MKQKRKTQQCILQFIITYVVLLASIAIYIGVVDPFVHYHVPYEGISSYINEQMYQTPGLIDYYSYDSAVVGTSMTENFRSSWFIDKGYNTIKLSYSGGRTKDIRTFYDRIFDKNPNIDFIWTDIEAYQLLVDPESRGRELPDYIYNDNVLDDVGYLWNGDVFWTATQRVIETIKGINHDIDDAYTWEEPELFSAKKLADAYRDDFVRYREEASTVIRDEEAASRNIEACKTNLNNLTPVIEAHPDTQFVFFFPPYSAIYWHRIKLQKEEWILDVDQYAAEKLLEYPNVKVYSFQDEFEWITNIDAYRDECHHNPQINYLMFEKIWNNENELTTDNIESRFNGMRDWLINYDFDAMWNRIEEE